MSDEKVLEVVAANGFMCRGVNASGEYNHKGEINVPSVVQTLRNGSLLVKCYCNKGFCEHPNQGYPQGHYGKCIWDRFSP